MNKKKILLVAFSACCGLASFGCSTPLHDLTEQCKNALNTACSPFTTVPPLPTDQDCTGFRDSIPERMKCLATACKEDCERHDSSLCTLAQGGVVVAQAGAFNALPGSAADELATKYTALAGNGAAASNGKAVGGGKGDDKTVKDKLKEECEKIKEWKTKCEGKEPPIHIPMPDQCKDLVSSSGSISSPGSGSANW